MTGRLPGFIRNPAPLSKAIDAIERGIERRSARVWAPRWVGPMLALRGILQPLIERQALGDSAPSSARPCACRRPRRRAPSDPELGVSLRRSRRGEGPTRLARQASPSSRRLAARRRRGCGRDRDGSPSSTSRALAICASLPVRITCAKANATSRISLPSSCASSDDVAAHLLPRRRLVLAALLHVRAPVVGEREQLAPVDLLASGSDPRPRAAASAG